MLMTLLLDSTAFLEFWVRVFADSGAWMLIFCGLMALVWFFYEGKRRGFIKSKTESWERDSVSRFLKLLIFLGIILGVITIVTAILTMILNLPPSYAYRDRVGNHFDLLTSISLLVMGLAMFIKPLQDVPIATIIGLIAGAAVTLLLALIIPSSWVANNVGKWVLVGVFILITSIVGALLKVWIDGIEAVAKFLSWPPIAIVLAAYCIVQGFMVLIGGVSFATLGA